MKLPDSTLKLFPILLVIAIVVFITSDRMRQQAQEDSPSSRLNSMAMGDDEHSHSHDGEADPHDDPEKNRLMGNFHNNEGIKAASKEQWEDAIRNFKMALHHIKNSEKALINMSTSYLKLGNYDEALKTLKELEAITPDHPLLHYNLACYHSLRQEIAASLQEMKKTIELGYQDFTSLQNDPDLEYLRQHASFKQWWDTLQTK